MPSQFHVGRMKSSYLGNGHKMSCVFIFYSCYGDWFKMSLPSGELLYQLTLEQQQHLTWRENKTQTVFPVNTLKLRTIFAFCSQIKCWLSGLRVRATDRHCCQMRRNNKFGAKNMNLATSIGERKNAGENFCLASERLLQLKIIASCCLMVINVYHNCQLTPQLSTTQFGS